MNKPQTLLTRDDLVMVVQALLNQARVFDNGMPSSSAYIVRSSQYKGLAHRIDRQIFNGDNFALHGAVLPGTVEGDESGDDISSRLDSELSNAGEKISEAIREQNEATAKHLRKTFKGIPDEDVDKVLDFINDLRADDAESIVNNATKKTA